MGDVGEASDPPFGAEEEYIWWEVGNEPIELGQSGTFSFRTAPTTISSGQGIVKQAPGISPTIIGNIAAPVAPDPRIVTTKSDTGTADDGVVSLREAVGYVLSHQEMERTVTFDVGSPVTLDPTKDQIVLGKSMASTEINITGDMTIIQRDAGSANKHRIFDVLANTTVKLTTLELKNGKVDGERGGAIRSAGDLTIDGSIFRQNEAMNSFGGAIAAVGGSLDVHGVSQFTGNSAAHGGAIYIGERIPADISYTEFVLNSASGQGGAIYIQSSSTANPTPVTLSNVDVNGNLASDRGGGIMVSAAAQGAAGTQLVLGSSTVRNNVASAASSKGGGIFFGAGVISLLGVTFQDNDADSGDGISYVTGTTLNPFSVYYFINDSWDEGTY